MPVTPTKAKTVAFWFVTTYNMAKAIGSFPIHNLKGWWIKGKPSFITIEYIFCLVKNIIPCQTIEKHIKVSTKDLRIICFCKNREYGTVS